MGKNTNYFIKFDLIILSVLQNQDRYAYEITKYVTEQTNNLVQPKQGTMYPYIHSMIDQGMITSYQKIINNKVRVYYHIEDKGRDYYKQELKKYHQLVDALDQLLKNNH